MALLSRMVLTTAPMPFFGLKAVARNSYIRFQYHSALWSYRRASLVSPVPRPHDGHQVNFFPLHHSNFSGHPVSRRALEMHSTMLTR